MHKNIIHRSRTFGIEFDQNRLKRSNFLRFWIFWKFSLNCLTCASFELLSTKFVYKCTNTKSCFIGNLVRIDQGLYLLTNFNFLIFFVILNLKISMYSWKFLCEETKIKQHTFSRKELYEIGEEGVWQSQFALFFFAIFHFILAGLSKKMYRCVHCLRLFARLLNLLKPI